MTALITDRDLLETLKAQRADTGADKFDEVWEGQYVMAALPNNQHQQIVTRLSAVFVNMFEWSGVGHVLAGANVSDRVQWQENYRCPDLVVYLKGTRAQNRDAFWLGGPDFAVEVRSPGDPTRQKLPFYAKVATRELLIVDRYPWQLELYRLNDKNNQLERVGRSDLDAPQTLESQVVPFTFRLTAGDERPTIEVVHVKDQQTWSV